MFKFLYIFLYSLFGVMPGAVEELRGGKELRVELVSGEMKSRVGPDEDGWVSLENVIQRTEERVVGGEEGDSAVWVVFSKQVGEENVMIRFPEDPVYRELSSGDLEISSNVQDGVYTLRVLSPVSFDQVGQRIEAMVLEKGISSFEVVYLGQNAWDLSYHQDGRFVGQRLCLTSHHLYVLETDLCVVSSEGHDLFVSSLDIL